MGMLDGQVALVVGGAGGIGAGVVRRYLAEGASVLAADRNPQRLAELRMQYDNDPDLVCHTADASTWDGSMSMAEAAVTAFGGLDVLVSCVGVYDFGIALAEIPPERLAAAAQECFAVNVGSLLLNIRAALPQLRARSGRVVVTGSYSSFRPSGGGVLYVAAKHAVVGLVRQLAYELAPEVRVNAVAPGIAQTVMSGLLALDQAPRDALLPGVEKELPLGQMPSVDDYGPAYALLGSASGASAMTGSVVVVDSGLLAHGLVAPTGSGR